MQRTLTSMFARSLVQRSAAPSTPAGFAVIRQLHAGSRLANEFADNGGRAARGGGSLRERLPNGVFVGGLNHEMGEEDLKRVFGQIGEVKAANVVYDRDTQRSKKFGFVYFAEPEAVSTVVSDPSLVGELGESLGVSKLEEKAPARARSPRSTTVNEPSKSIFVAGFPPSMSKAELESAMSPFYPVSGVIDEVFVPLNRIERMEEDEFAIDQDEPRRNKGFAFVRMTSVEDAEEFLNNFQKAIQEDGFKFDGSKYPPTANFALEKKPEGERFGSSGGRGGGQGGGRGGFSGRGGRGGFGGGRDDRRGGGRSGGARDWIKEDRGRYQSRGEDF